MNANDREVISGLTKQIELLQEQIKSMNEVMAKMVEKDNPKVETEEDRRNKLIEETRSHTEELNKKLEQRERNHNIAYKAKKLGEVVNNFGERVFTMDYLNTLSGFAIDEAYDNYFQDGNCKVGTKKLSDEELEKYEILFEGKKPKEEVKEVETDEKTKIAEGFDKNINDFNNTTYTCVYMMANMANLIDPIMPDTSNAIRKMLSLPEFKWKEQAINGNIEVKNLKLLFERIDDKKILDKTKSN